MLEKGSRDGVKGTLISGVRTRGSGPEEGRGGKSVIGAVEISSGAMGAMTGVAENHLGDTNREGLWTLWMVQNGRI